MNNNKLKIKLKNKNNNNSAKLIRFIEATVFQTLDKLVNKNDQFLVLFLTFLTV